MAISQRLAILRSRSLRAVLDELTCVGAEGCIAANKPEKGVRIE